MALGAILGSIGSLASAAGALQGGSNRPITRSSEIPEWQKKRLTGLYDQQLAAANQGLGQDFQRARQLYGGLDTIAQMGQLTDPNSVLGQRAAGNFIGSEGYNQILDQSNQRIREQFEQTEMPGILGRFSASGRIGSPSMMRTAEQAQAGLARGIAQNEANLLQNERQNQMQAASQIGNILQNRDILARGRAQGLMALDPAMIRQQRLSGLNSLIQGNYGRKNTRDNWVQSPLEGIGGNLLSLSSMANKQGWKLPQKQYTPAPIRTPWGGP